MIPFIIKAITLAKGRPSPLQGGTYASVPYIALYGLGPYEFFLMRHASIPYIILINIYFLPLNT